MWDRYVVLLASYLATGKCTGASRGPPGQHHNAGQSRARRRGEAASERRQGCKAAASGRARGEAGPPRPALGKSPTGRFVLSKSSQVTVIRTHNKHT